MSPARRRLLLLVGLVAVVLLALVVVPRLSSDDAAPGPAAPQDTPGPVLLVPGYGGATGALEVLAATLRAAGRTATVVDVPGDGTGDLRQAAAALEAAVEAALASSGAPSVDVVGYSAGGVVARLWAQDHADRARRVVTLGSPHHGTKVAALGAAFAPGACPVACQQLVPGSDLLDELNAGDETPDGPKWLSLWTSQDETVTPPDSARLDGAVDVVLQDICPGISVTHSDLPRTPLVQGIVAQALSADPLTAPRAEQCAQLSS